MEGCSRAAVGRRAAEHTRICAVDGEGQRGINGRPAVAKRAAAAVTAASCQRDAAGQAQRRQQAGPGGQASASAAAAATATVTAAAAGAAAWVTAAAAAASRGLEAQGHDGTSHVGELQPPEGRIKHERLSQAAAAEAAVGVGRRRRLGSLQGCQHLPCTQPRLAVACKQGRQCGQSSKCGGTAACRAGTLAGKLEWLTRQRKQL
jgi:hypothetical protein